MGGMFMKGAEVRAFLGITRWKFQEMEKAGIIKRVHLAWKQRGRLKVPADQGYFRRHEIQAMIGDGE